MDVFLDIAAVVMMSLVVVADVWCLTTPEWNEDETDD